MAELEIDPGERIDRIIAAHRAYMAVFWPLEATRLSRGMNVSSLHALRLVVERSWPPSVVFVAQALRMHHSHASRILTTLERQGFVTAERDSADRRQRLYSATEKGRTLTCFFGEGAKRRAWQLISCWPAHKQTEIMHLLEQLVRSLRTPI